MKRTQSIPTLLATALLAYAPLALAQTTGSSEGSGMQPPQSGAITHQPMSRPAPGSTAMSSNSPSSMSSESTGAAPPVMGEHTMQGTVESVGSNGMVHVLSDGMNLRVHFPDAAQNLKKGDKITLHLGYTKDG